MPQSPPPRMAVTVASSVDAGEKAAQAVVDEEERRGEVVFGVDGGRRVGSSDVDDPRADHHAACRLQTDRGGADLALVAVGVAEEVAAALDDFGHVAEQQREHTPRHLAQFVARAEPDRERVDPAGVVARRSEVGVRCTRPRRRDRRRSRRCRCRHRSAAARRPPGRPPWCCGATVVVDEVVVRASSWCVVVVVVVVVLVVDDVGGSSVNSVVEAVSSSEPPQAASAQSSDDEQGNSAPNHDRHHVRVCPTIGGSRRHRHSPDR